MTSIQINESGLRHVSHWLERHGFRVDPAIPAAGRSTLTATGPVPIVVAVRAALHPAVPVRPTPAEWFALQLEAASTGRKPFTALVTLTPGGPLLCDIEWLKS